MKKYGFNENNQISIYGFDELEKCPKCGVFFHTRAPEVAYAFATLIDKNDPFRETVIPEHLDHTCVKCGYKFMTACYDAKRED